MSHLTHWKSLLATLPLLALSACDAPPESSNQLADPPASKLDAADLLLSNGAIYTVAGSSDWVQAVAIKDGKYLYVGSDEAANQYRGPDTQAMDLGGKMAMPGINDAHVHSIEGAIKELYECNFAFTAGPDEIATRVAECSAQAGESTWVRGGQWGSDFFVTHSLESPRQFLDAVSLDKAVILSDDALHNAWLNSKALQLLNIDRNTVNPPGVDILRDAKGEPTGVILEVFGFLKDALPDWSDAQYLTAARRAATLANQYGITGIKDASDTDAQIRGFKTLDERGEISVHFAANLYTPYGHREQPLDIASLIERRDAMRSTHVDTRFVKLFMDGVPTASRTAAMLAPYLPAHEGSELVDGELHIGPELLKQDVAALDAAGFTVKIHTAGDRSVQVALDAIEHTRKTNGNSGLRHELAHAGYISDADLPRFAQLNAVADLSPYIWNPSPIIQSVISAVGERGEYYWPIKSLLASGAPVLAGSDWPAAAVNINPWPSIEAMVTRADPSGDYPGKLWPEQAITLAQALEIYTLKGAQALLLGSASGSVEVGKSADLIVLNQNLFEVPITAVSDTEVEMTLFAGKQVYPR